MEIKNLVKCLNLPFNNLTIDVGAYYGKFTKAVTELYNCNVIAFEPISYFALKCSNNFKDNLKIKVETFALGNENKEVEIFVNKECSSLFRNWIEGRIKAGKIVKDIVKVPMIKLSEYLKEKNINSVDLLKINVEGGEYAIIDDLIESGSIIKIKNLLLQFHRLPFDSKEYRMKLSKTHQRSYITKNFKWDLWKLV